MDAMFQLDRLYPYALPPAITFLVSLFLASLVLQTGERNKETRLFAFFCLLQALINLATTLNAVIVSKEVALSVSRFADMFYVFIIPLAMDFIFEAIKVRHRNKLIRGLYIFSLALCPFTQTQWYFSGMQKHFFGFFPQGGPAFQIFGFAGLACMFYVIPILWTEAKRSPISDQRVKARFILYGILANLALTAGNILPILGARIYPPGNFGFIPLGFMAYGLLQHNLLQAAKGGLSKDFLPRTLTIFAWAPLVIAVFFWLTAEPGLFYPDITKRLFPYALPPILSYISCFVLATFCFMQRTVKPANILFGLIVTIWGYLNVDIGFNMLHKDPNLALQLSRFCHIFLVYQIGLSVHFIYSIIGRKQRWTFVYPCYTLGFILMLFTQSHWYFQDVYTYYWGFFAKKNIAFDVFGAVSFIVIVWGAILLYQANRKETDIDLKKKYFYVLIGVLVTGTFNMFNIPANNGIPLYPLGNFTFIPILIMGYGVFRHNILTINTYTRRRILEQSVRIILVLGYTALIFLCSWAVSHDKGTAISYSSLWGPFNPDLIFDRIYPYGIPPLIAFICATYFSMLSIRLGRHQPEAIIFSLLCFLMAFVSFDILMNGIITDPAIGMQISRLSHLFLVFAPALCLHLIYIIIRRKIKWWLIYAAYIIALIMMSATQTTYYIHGMYHYYWGYYADGNFLFNVFALFFLLSLGYGIALLISAYKQSNNLFQKHRLYYLALGFAVSGALYVGDIFTLEGYEIYPPGNFVFIPLLLWAYALFRQNLNDVLQITRTFLRYVGLLFAALIIAVVFKRICPSDWIAEIYLLGILLSILLLGAISYIWNNILTLFFGEQKEKLKTALETVHSNLSTSRTLHSIFKILKNTLFTELLCSRYTLLVAAIPAVSGENNTRKNKSVFSGWEAFNPRKNLFLEINAVPPQDASVETEANHPLLQMFIQTRDLTPREQIEEWMMERDIVLDSQDPLCQPEYILPIYFEQNLSCLILFGNKIDGSLYSSDEREFIHQLGFSLGPYLENAKLLQGVEKKVEERTHELKNALNQTRAKEEEISHINEVIQIINSTLDLNLILSSFQEALLAIFDFNQIGIFLIDPKNESLFLTNYAGRGITEDKIQALRKIPLPIQPGVSLNADTVLRNKPACFPNITPELMRNATSSDQKAFAINPMLAMLLCPLEFQKKVIGTIIFAHTEKHFDLSESDINKIQRYVSQIATAVNNARLTEETRRALTEARAKELEIAHINQVVQTVNSTLDLDEVLNALMHALQEIFSFNQIGIMLIDEQTSELVFYKPYGKFTEEQVSRHSKIRISLAHGKNWFVKTVRENRPIYIPLLTPDLAQKFESDDRALYEIGLGKSYLSYPLEIQKKVIGVIVFGNCDEPFNLTEDDIIKIQRYITHIATAIHNARLYNDLNTARAEAESATKYKSEFLANMSHEIRTPLNAILGLTGLALNTALTPKQMDYLKKIKESSTALFRIVNDILDFSKIEAGKLDLETVEFKIDDVMANIANMFSGQVMEKGIEMIFTRSPDIPEFLEGDPLRLGQIITNLVSNAFKFTDRGEILIRAELASKQDGHVLLKFTVKDTGIGIDPAHLLVLFDPFTQADGSTTRKYGGTGLGLAICRQLTEMMGGEINAKSLPGMGSTFYFTARFACPSVKPKTLPAPHPDLRGLKVLVVDDNKTVQLIITDVLKSFHFEPTTVSSGEAALTALFEAKKDDPFDLVLLDWKLPGMDGIECARQIRKHPDLGRIPIVMMTAFGREDVKDLADQAGINAYLTKPMTSSMMIDTFMEVFGRITDRKIMAESLHAKELETFKKMQGARLLLVEDNSINQQVAVELLKGAGLVIDIANNGREACEAILKSDYDAVLMDVQMPLMDGYEATRRIREHPEKMDLPIIAMTAHAMTSEKQKCFDAGMNDHIAKPIDPKLVFETLSKWIQPKAYAMALDPEKGADETGHQTVLQIELPDELPGVDITMGINRMAGNKTVYRDLLIQFRKKYKNIIEDMQNAMADGRYDDASHMAHAVKGVAGNVGAHRVHQTADALESAISDRRREVQTRLLATFKNAMEQLFSSIEILEQDVGDITEIPASEKITPSDAIKIESLLSECAYLLKSDFGEAMNCIESLKKILKGTPLTASFMKLEEYMNTFNIEDALSAVATITQELHSRMK